MKCMPKLISGLLIGLMLGLWFGVNIGRERPIFSNPFRKESIQERFRKAGRGLGDAIKESADSVREKFEE